MGDVPLNEDGLIQAEDLAGIHSLTKVNTILASPKKRAMMTVKPLSQKIGKQIEILEELDQIRSGESESDFRNRVERVLNKVSEEKWPSPTIICTHSDWLGMASQIIPSDASDLKYHLFQCAEVMEFEIRDGVWIQI